MVEELERVGQSLEPADRCRWFLELGSACESLVPERHRALPIYRQSWEADPSATDALHRARSLATELGRLRDFVAISQVELERETDDGRAEQLAVQIAEALLDLRDRDAAAGFLVRMVSRFPGSMFLHDALGTVGHDDDWSGEVERLIDIGEETRNAEGQAQVFLRAARVLHLSAPGDPRYEMLLRRVLKCDPYNDSARWQLQALFQEQRRWDDLAGIEEEFLAAFPGADEQAVLCQRFAFGWCDNGDDARAVAYAERAVALGGFVHPIAGLTLLRGIYAPRRQWNELLTAVEAVIDTSYDEDAVVHGALLAGTIAWRALRDLDRARTYFDRVRRVATDSILLIEFDDAMAELRSPEAIGEEQRALMDAARRAAKSETVDRALDAWRRAVAADPQRRAPRRGLARLLYQAERWRGLVDALKDEETHACHTDGERVAVLHQLVTVYRDRLRQDILAVQTLNRILEVEPGNLAALDQLDALHEAMSRWSELVATLQRKLKHVDDPDEQVQLHLRLAQLYADKLGNETESLRALDAAHAIDPSQIEVAAQLEDAYARRRDWERLIALKRRQLNAFIEEPATRIERLVELAQLASEKLKKPAEAIAAWSEVLEAAPQHDGALAALEKLFVVGKNFARLAEIVAQRAALTPDPSLRVQHLTRLAGLYSSELADAPRAIAVWRQVLEVQPGHARAHEKLKQLYVIEKDWSALERLLAADGKLEECARLFERQAEEEEGAARVELWYRAGVLRRDALKQGGPARRAFEQVLALEPQHAEAAEALIPFYEQARDSRKLAGVLAIQLRHTGEPGLRKTRLERLAVLFDIDLDEPVTAFDWQLQAFEGDPQDERGRRRLENLARRINLWPLLIEAYLRAAPGLAPAQRVPLLQVVAGAQERTLEDLEAATATWRSILELDGASEAALAALERLYSRARAWNELHGIYSRKLELAAEADAKLDLWCKMAALAEEQGDDARALAAYRGVLEVAGDEPRALGAVDRILERSGEWRELDAIVERELGLTSTSAEDRLRLLFRRAELREHKLDDAAAAVGLYRQMLAEAPEHEGARVALERFLAQPAYELEAAIILEPIYDRLGEAERLVQVQEVRVAHSSSSDEQTALLHAIARTLHERLHQPERALAALGRALRITPGDQTTYTALERLADEVRSWSSLVELYREVAARSLSIEQHVEIRCRLARLYRGKLNEPERAVATYTRVLDLNADNAEAPEALEALLAGLGRWRELVDRLRNVLEREPAGPRAKERWLRLAELLDRELDDPAGAVESYRRLLEIDPDGEEAIAALHRLVDRGRCRTEAAVVLEQRYRAAGDLGGLLRLLAGKLAQSPWPGGAAELEPLARESGDQAVFVEALRAVVERADPPLVVEAQLALGRVDEQRGDDAGAEAHFRAALALDEKSADALTGIDRVLLRGKRHGERVEILRRCIEVGLGDPVARTVELAELQRDKLDDLPAARASYQRALELAPGDVAALRGLAHIEEGDAAEPLWRQILAKLPDDEEALVSLALQCEQHERWSELADLLERRLVLAANGPLEPVLVEQLALVASRLGDGERAIAAWRRAADLSPESLGPLREVIRRVRDAQRTEELAELLARALTLPSLSPHETVQLATELGALEGTILGRADRATAAWRRVLAVDPHHAQALTAMRALIAQTGDREAAIAVAEELAQAALARGDRAQAVAAWLEAAGEWDERGDAERAAADYRRILAVEPAHAVAADQLERFHRGRGEWSEVAAILRERQRATLDVEAKVELLRTLATLEEGPLADPRASMRSLLQAFDLDGRWSAYGDDLRRLARASGELKELADHLGRKAATFAEPVQRIELYLEVGERREELDDLPAAIEAYRAALAIDDAALVVLERLEGVYRKKSAPELLDVLARRAEVTLDRDEQLRIFADVALTAARLGRWVRAIAAHRKCAELESDAARRARHLYDAGVIYRDELASFDEACECFERAVAGFRDDGGQPPPEVEQAHQRMVSRGRSRAQR